MEREALIVRCIRIQAKTLRQPAVLTGIGLHSGLTTSVRLIPAEAGAGIEFVRTDLPGTPSVRATNIDAGMAPFRTGLKNGPAEVHTVEHLLSALAGLGITDCGIEIDGLEMPGMDGSAKIFAQSIQDAGIVQSNGQSKALVLDRAIAVEDSSSSVSAVPLPGELRITYLLDYPGHPLAQGTFEISLSTESYLKEIAAARTFAIRKDAEAMRAAGLGKGANYQNTVIVDGTEALETKLRFSNEPVRHKILDLIGDLYTLGCPLQAHVIARCSGHRQNRQLVLQLRELLD